MARITEPDCVDMSNLKIYTHALIRCCAKRRVTGFTHVLEGDKPFHHFPRFIPKRFPGQSLLGVGEEMRFRPRAVVVGKELMSGCTRIASREYVHDK